MKNKVCIELHTDNNYVIPALVTITSILKNKKKDSIYEIRVLGNNLSEDNIALFKKAGINIIPHKNSFEQFEGAHAFVSSTDLFKFDLPQVLPDWDKVLYIDTDMIIQEDLTELFNTDLGDNYVAAVKDMFTMKLNPTQQEVFGHKKYFNAGMMLLNLKKMREDNIREKLIDYKLNKDSGRFMSQDALNTVFSDKVIWLNLKWNYLAIIAKYFTAEVICKFFNITLKEYGEIQKRPPILHLASAEYKAWKYEKTPYSEVWMKYFNKSVCKKIKLVLEENPFIERTCEKNQLLKFFLLKIFYAKNEYINGKKYKVFNFLGLKIKFSKKGK